jgi:sensor histidine kinase regulating citrate/malate metabolism|tara:strand:- start:150 stop:482 length:333 start_codon:yes stop_codon:yes gene_type:complete
MWNKNVCLTSRKTILLIVVILFSTLVFAGVWSTTVEEVLEMPVEEKKMWVPTKEDIAYQDSMYTIIKNTQNDITDIKKDIVHILERLDYEDGTWDSIRYVKGGEIDKRRN